MNMFVNMWHHTYHKVSYGCFDKGSSGFGRLPLSLLYVVWPFGLQITIDFEPAMTLASWQPF